MTFPQVGSYFHNPTNAPLLGSYNNFGISQSSTGSSLNPYGVASAVTGLIGDVANFGFGIWDRIQSQKNYREQFDYQKALNQIQMDREDTAYQRAVEDIRSAGLSPLALTSGAPTQALSGTEAQNISGAVASDNASSRLASLAGLKQQIELQKNNQAIEWYNAMTSRMAVLETGRSNLSNEEIGKTQAGASVTSANAAASQAETAKQLAGIESGIFNINRHYAEQTGMPYGQVKSSSSGGSVSIGQFKLSGHSSDSVSVTPPLTIDQYLDQYTGSDYDFAKKVRRAQDSDLGHKRIVAQEIVRSADSAYQDYYNNLSNKYNALDKFDFKELFYKHFGIPYFIGTHGEPTIDIQGLFNTYKNIDK